MKKALTLSVLTVLCFILCACDPGSYHLDREKLSGVTGVDLIEYSNPDQKRFLTWVPDQSGSLKPFDSSRVTVLETLSGEKIEDFLDAFSKEDILNKYYAYDSPKDVCIRLKYDDGSFLIVWANYAENTHSGYIGEYRSDGTVRSVHGSFSSPGSYRELVGKYFDYGLE